ncbi:MAG: hypothetical protein V3S44_01265 [Alphaproteobacteria bacterium]
MSDDPYSALKTRIDAVEEAYEYMLAYAGQGRERDDDGAPGERVSVYLEKAAEAVSGIASAAADCLGGAADQTWKSYLEIFAVDAGRALGVIRLVLAQEAISSALIDNLNASIHLRTLLTDLFLIDEILKSRQKR